MPLRYLECYIIYYIEFLRLDYSLKKALAWADTNYLGHSEYNSPDQLLLGRM